MIETVKAFLLAIQNDICLALETEDGGAIFQQDEWLRQQGGGGITRVIENGNIFEKGGVNFSHVHGDTLPPTASAIRPELAGRQFQALGVSLVMHPKNPYVPTTHANWRFFLAEKTGEPTIWWFGGGYDLTPYYGFDDDCKHWHSMAKKACDPFGKEIYPTYKKWCDDYFYLTHRQEPRGIGGLFFDDVNTWDFNKTFEFVQSTANSFLPAYLPIVQKRKATAYGEREKAFQCYRRGRYVEFNLVYDRGTLFGLQSNGRTESILMSLPPEVTWRYQWQPEPGTPEEKLYTHYLQAKEWV